MSYQQTGQRTVVQEQSRSSYGPGGYQTVLSFVGIRGDIYTADTIEQLAEAYRNLNWPTVVTPLEGPTARLEVTITGTGITSESPITTEWTFTTRGSVVPLEEHPTFVEKLAVFITVWEAAGEETVQLGLRTLRDYLAGTMPEDADGQAMLDAILNPINGLLPFIRLILAGTKSYLRPEPVVASIQRYQPTAVFVPNLATCGVVYSNGSLVAGLGLPASIAAKMPSGEWLAEEIELQSSSTGEKVVTQSFRYAVRWDTVIYPQRA